MMLEWNLMRSGRCYENLPNYDLSKLWFVTIFFTKFVIHRITFFPNS